MRTLHRIVGLFVLVFLLYLGITGSLIQLIDLRSLFRHAPATDPNMMGMREGFNGPGDFLVIGTADYSGPILPDFDYAGALPRLTTAARTRLGDAPIDFTEFRMRNGHPVGQVQAGKQMFRLDFASGEETLGPAPPRENDTVPSLRNTVKGLHRMTSFGDWALWINPLISLALALFVITGLIMYFRLWAARRRLGRGGLLWAAGGGWRTLHRWASLCAVLFIAVVAFSGAWLAYESLCLSFALSQRTTTPGPRPRAIGPLPDAQVAGMLNTALAGYRAVLPGEPLKVLRLRVYGGMPQAMMVAGVGDGTRQLAFNALTGRRVSETEPGYPPSGFPFGWQAHQLAKSIHRGDFIGVGGRAMDLIAGLSIIFLSVSGGIMYIDLWNRRRRAGRAALIWI